MGTELHRKRMRRREHAGEARFVTFSCHRRLPLFANDRIKQVFADRLSAVHREQRCQLIAWVLMPEHVHLLLVPDVRRHSLAEVLTSLKRPIAERVIRRWRELKAPIFNRIADSRGRTRFWQPGGGYDRNIAGDDELFEKIDYMHDNPVRRGLVAKSTDWPWSSARWYECGEGLVTMDGIA